jgi:hypothetical protein
MGNRGYRDFETAPHPTQPPPVEQRTDMKGWINFKRPVGLDTVVILFGMLVGGLSFKSDTTAALAALKDQVNDLKTQLTTLQASTAQQLTALTGRVDTAIMNENRK